MSEMRSKESHFDENEYARPNQRWICGWAADGGACPLGPTNRGNCRSAFECSPYCQDDTWVCARTRSHGGPCEEGPLPDGVCCRPINRCQPTRSIMAKRGIVSFFAFALAIGVALIMVGSPARTELVSPGPLNPQHSTMVQSCADCHVGGQGQPSDWIRAAFDSTAATEQSDLCLKCHGDIGKYALSPHGVAGKELAVISRKAKDNDQSGADPVLLFAAQAGFGSPVGKHGELACAACHREHHGKDFELVNTSNQQCQICHVATFDSLSHGHPEFSDYPYQRRTRLYFDHLSHFGRHFEERTASETTPQSCNDCHVQDVTGSYMLVRGFEQTCASCHSEQIEDDLDLGFAFATIPGLDVETLRNNKNKGIDVGQWPDLYPLHVEAAGELGPLIKLLLSSNENLAETMQHLDGVDLCNLSEATVAELEEVEKLVWAYKETLYDVLRGGQPAVQQRLNSVLAPQVSKTEIAEWVKLIPIELLAKMQERWLPMLIKEVEAHREGRQLPMQDEASNVDAAKVLDEERRIAGAVTSGWYLRESDMSLRYRPTGHADMFLKSLLEVSARFAVDLNSGSIADQNQAFGSAPAMRRVFASLSSPVATGRCLKCHTTDAVPTGGARIQWLANRPSLTQRHFTEFKHSPHITLLDDKACYTCHQFKTDEKPKRSPFRAEYIHSNWSPSTDPHRFASNFVAMTKSRCANCHNPSGAGDSCRSCHNYHVR